MSTDKQTGAQEEEEFRIGKDDRLFLALEDERSANPERRSRPWRVLVVDDEPQIHAVTKLALDDFTYAERPLEFLHAYSGVEARQVLRDNGDIALILLDVVMETEHAGLEIARFVRQELDNPFVRIILRTGQPGIAPERTVLREYDINDYRAKTELTQDRMFTVVHTALASYWDLVSLARSRMRLNDLVAELERSNKELEQFASVASHDLQSPLAEVINFAQMLTKRWADGGDEKSLEYLGHILSSSRHMRTVVQSLLSYSRVGAGGPQREVCDFGAIIEEAKGHLMTTIDQRKALFESAPLPSVSADRLLMVQLMQNLIGNAIKYQPRDPPIVRVGARRERDAWVLSVQDEGIGIDPGNFERVFEIFERLHAKEYEGNGIGLSICQKIVRMHGGRIWVESKPPGGSTFLFSIPDGPPPE